MIDEMAGAVDAGMPPIRLRDAKFNENSKDFTWSTRQTIDIRRLSTALRSVGIKAESDTSFGDSIMVVITPTGTDRQIKGQVLADGTIRLAGCRDDGELGLSHRSHAMVLFRKTTSLCSPIRSNPYPNTGTTPASASSTSLLNSYYR